MRVVTAFRFLFFETAQAPAPRPSTSLAAVNRQLTDRVVTLQTGYTTNSFQSTSFVAWFYICYVHFIFPAHAEAKNSDSNCPTPAKS